MCNCVQVLSPDVSPQLDIALQYMYYGPERHFSVPLIYLILSMDFLRRGHFVVRTLFYLLDLCLSVRRVNDVVNMSADGAALVEARAGVTFGVELYVPLVQSNCGLTHHKLQ